MLAGSRGQDDGGRDHDDVGQEGDEGEVGRVRLRDALVTRARIRSRRSWSPAPWAIGLRVRRRGIAAACPRQLSPERRRAVAPTLRDHRSRHYGVSSEGSRSGTGPNG